ncbi:MAG: hypothetical protein ACTSRI_16815 [Promethearchaeota archaeon]
MNIEKKKRVYKFYLVFFIGTSFAAFVFLFIYYWPILSEAFVKEDILWWITGIILFRIIVISIMSMILFFKWFKQEAIYTSDAYFLFGLFFTIFLFGKIIDLFLNMAYICEYFIDVYFILLKIRYFFLVFNTLPLLYLGLEVLITFFNIYIKEMTTQLFNRIRLITILIFLILVSFFIFMAPDIISLTSFLPLITMGTAIGIIVMFLFMYKSKRLSQAHGLIIGIGFICAVLTAIIRSILTTSLEPISVVIAEIFDFFAYFVIFAGFITKPGYAKNINLKKNSDD